MEGGDESIDECLCRCEVTAVGDDEDENDEDKGSDEALLLPFVLMTDIALGVVGVGGIESWASSKRNLFTSEKSPFAAKAFAAIKRMASRLLRCIMRQEWRSLRA